jgi:hypothetical protein
LAAARTTAGEPVARNELVAHAEEEAAKDLFAPDDLFAPENWCPLREQVPEDVPQAEPHGDRERKGSDDARPPGRYFELLSLLVIGALQVVWMVVLGSFALRLL